MATIRTHSVKAAGIGTMVLALSLLTGCASADPYAEEALGPLPQLDCSQIDESWIRLDYRPRFGPSDRLRAMGYDGWTDVRMITEFWTDANGVQHERIVGQEGIAWRYVDPACRMRSGRRGRD